MSSFTFSAELFLYPGEAAWYFITLPHDVADEIDDLVTDKGGFGSVKVDVTIGGSAWKTSLFPDKKAASFVLPVKKAVRAAEDIDDGDVVTVTVLPVIA